ncbi:transcription-associated protein 1 [Botryosphaeria dothidea]
MADRNMEVYLNKLADPASDLKVKTGVATEIRDSIELYCSGSTYGVFLEKFIPVFIKLLEGAPVFVSTSPEQRLRNCILEILHRLPMSPTEALEPYAAQIVDRLMVLAKIENEDNAALCMKTIMDFERHQTKALQDKVQPFLDLIAEMFENMDAAVKETFENPSGGPSQEIPSTPRNSQYSQSPRPGSPGSGGSSTAPDLGGEQQQTRHLLKGMQSFKVLAECPIIVVSLFQAYRNCVHKNVKRFVPLIKNVLLLQAGPQEKAHAEAKARGDIFTGVSKEIKNRAAFGEFITAQVKTMSFLAYLLRVYAQQLTDFLPTLPDIVVRLLQDCPREKSGARKELLVAIRHIINFNFRKIFLKKIDELLDERTLIGDGLTVYETMRPLAYSMLADLIHHLRESLSQEQIRRTIEVYTKNLHDSFPGTSFQTMSAKLLLNMAECIAKLEPKQEARYYLVMILNAIGDKFAAMNRQFDNAVKLSKQYSTPSIEATPENYLAEKDSPPDWDEIDIFNATPIKTSNPRERASDPIADNKFLFKNLLHGLKNLFYQLRVCNPPKIKEEIDPSVPTPANWHEVSFGYNAEEVEVLIKLFREGAQVFRYYGVEKVPGEQEKLSPGELLANQHMMSSGKEEKELLEAFATVFHHIDPATFHEVFESEIPHLYEMMFEHNALLHVPQFLLASEATSPSFAGMLLQFLMGKIDEVGTADVKKSSILLRLFKLSFMAVTLFSQQNEQVLLPHVTKIVTKSIELSTTAEEPMNYFLLLRSLFRSIGGGRFEHLYKEILPLLEMLLEVLNSLLVAARKPSERDLFVELSLTVPARLSNLLPHLSYLMRPLVVALRAGSDLVGQGLRTLELCVDNLTADYLDPIMAPVIDELMQGLWEHLKPTPYSHFHAHTTMRILGKLGGRNRRFIIGPSPLDYKPYADDEPSIDIRLIGSIKDRAFPTSVGVDSAIGKLHETPKTPAAKKSDQFHKQQAFKFIISQAKLLLGADSLPDDFAQQVRLQADDLSNGKHDVGPDVLEASEREKSNAKKDAQQDTLRKLLKAVMFSTSIPELKEDATTFMAHVCRHFALLEVGTALATIKHRKKPFDVNNGEGPVVIESRVVLEAIGDSLASDHVEVKEAAEEALKTLHKAAVTIFGAPEKAEKLTLFKHLADIFCHNCHQEEWFVKHGGTLGIDILTTKLGLSDAWINEGGRLNHFSRALVYVMQDMPLDLTSSTRGNAQSTLENLLRRCSGLWAKEDLKSPPNSDNKLLGLCGFLVTMLSHSNKHVRKAAQDNLKIIAESTGTEVHELVLPVSKRLLDPIFNKPLRALPFSIQIGYIDAVTFCLKLGHGVLTFNELLTRLLTEALALADAEDEGLTAKPYEQRNAEAIVSLRVACIRLLSTAQTFPEFSSNPPNQTFLRVIAVFFKALYSKSPQVVEAANAGLQGVLHTTNKLPKDVLQSGLRPILVNLQDPKKLTVEGLDGLARLLKLLTNYFKVEIGSRLLDHMKVIADQRVLQAVSFGLIEQHKAMKTVTAILNVFHLLPSAAVSFLGQLVQKVMELEGALRRTHYSPFRAPLIKYLNHYPKEAWNDFAPRIRDHASGRFFAQILADPASGSLREVLVNDTQGFINSFAIDDESKKWPAAINAIHVVESVCKYPETSTWLVNHADLRKALLDAGKSLETRLRQNTIEASLRLAVDQAGERLIGVFTNYLTHEPESLDFFVEIVDAVTAEELKASPALFHFIYKIMISSESVEYWRMLIIRCIDLYTGRNTSQKTKTFVFHYIVNPIFAMDVMRNWDSLFGAAKGTQLMDRSMTETIHNRLWRVYSVEQVEETGQLGVDHSRMELLQMTTLLVKYHHGLIQDARKDVIKFGWNYIRLEDIINKHAAYVLIAYFIAHYDTPPKIAIQIYSQLLRAHQNEGRPLVMQALEVLAPVLKKRIGGADNKQPPMWARIPKKILTEESSNLQQLISIFNFLVRYPDLFYEAREPLSTIIIPSLPKIAQPPSLGNDHKKIALNLINLLRRWEERSAKESGLALEQLSIGSRSPKRRHDGSMVVPDPPSRQFVAPPPLRQSLIKYLATFIMLIPERYPVPSTKIKESTAAHNAPPAQSTEACQMAVQLLQELLSSFYWSDLDIDAILGRVENVIMTEPKQEEKPEAATTRLINALQVLKVFVNVKSGDWIMAHLPQLQKILDKPVRNENAEIQDCLHAPSDEDSKVKLQPLMKRILEVLPEPNTDEDGTTEETPSTEFVAFCNQVATETLGNNNNIAAVNLLWTLCQRRPDDIDQQHIVQVVKVLNSMSREHLTAPNQMQGQNAMHGMRPEGQNGAPLGSYEHEIQIGLILKAIDFLAARMTQLGDQRRPFLTVLASLVERSPSTAICQKIVDLTESWIFDSSEPVPTLKEKTAVLSKMQAFESRTDKTLLTKFLGLVIRIYEDPKITRSELTVRMEHAFLIGTRAEDVEMRNRFMNIFDRSLSRTASVRLTYVITCQNWDILGRSFWLNQVIHLMFGSVEMNSTVQLHSEDFKVMSASTLFGTYSKEPRVADVMVDDQLESYIANHRQFVNSFGEVKVRDLLDPLTHLQHVDTNLAHDIWVNFFPLCWSALPKDDQVELEKGLVALLTKDYHMQSIDERPNCVQTVLEGVVKARPRVKFPPHVMKYLAQTYNAWYTALCYMEDYAIDPIIDTAQVRESNLDALLGAYSQLEEHDLFYGTWRRRCQYVETNAALSYEQNGMWDNAQKLYETAQIKARTGALPFSQGEYMLWEDHWVVCAQKLQQWEILSDFAKHENFSDLYLESMWRIFDAWQNNDQREQLESSIKAVSDAPTPRRIFFQAFLSLLKLHGGQESNQDFNKVVDDAIQLSIRKWHQLPKRITNAHIPLLQNFQQLVELHDASVICASLAATNQQNLDHKSQELKLLLSTWRDRLPNFWDDINAWQDLVTWRQHIFHLINGKYLQLLPQQQGNASGNSYAYRGYHETAWIINRFAHVARKHSLPDVCINQLSRIYTLPNIEIQEAFLKLREQAKCHYQNKQELNSGLDVINNTNLNYFGAQQKAEFYTLKGMFLSKLGQTNDANDAFGTALYFDIKLPKAWKEWGRYNDNLFKQDPSNIDKAESAISCYLEAASQYKNHKSRELLGRILWLLSLDTADHRLSKTFESFKGDTPSWYWITYIPQLFVGLSRPEAAICRQVLGKLAKTYPQALFFQLRTSREDFHQIRKQQEAKEAREKAIREKKAAAQAAAGGGQGQQAQGQNQGQGQNQENKQGSPSRPGTSGGNQNNAQGQNGGENNAQGANGQKTEGGQTTPNEQQQPRKPWDYVEEVMAALKTAFPLLALSMETMSDGIAKHFKCPPDEDAYRLIVALLNDGLSYVGRQPALYAQDVKLPSSTEANITRFAESVLPPHIRRSFEADFVNKKPTMYEYIQKLRKWRNRFEEKLDRRRLTHHLESYTTHLSDFKYQKFDEIEVPGQYLLHRDKNQDFVRIERFLPDIDLVRTVGFCHRRLKIRGHDGSTHPFAIQHPAARNCRREERILQLFRIFNTTLAKRKESRRRNLQFTLPLMVPLSPGVRMVQDDSSYVSLQGIYEDYCRRNGVNKDEPILFAIEKLRSIGPQLLSQQPPPGHPNADLIRQRNIEQSTAIRLEIFAAIQEKYVPPTAVLDYFNAIYPSFADLWLFRRQFSYQLAALTFTTYVMHMNTRYPHKMNISRKTGNIWGSELVPSMAGGKPLFHNPEPVPFRLTPNLQTMMGPLATEGIFAPALMAIARCLVEPEGELEMQLSIFVRDEMVHWHTQQHRQNVQDGQLRESVEHNAGQIVKRAKSLAEVPNSNNLPANQTVVDLVAVAVNPGKLCMTDPLWMPYL